MNKKYRIADYIIEIEAPFAWRSGERFADFEEENNREADFIVHWTLVDVIDDRPSEEYKIFENQPSQYYLTGSTLMKYERVNVGREPYFCLQTNLRAEEGTGPVQLLCRGIGTEINLESALGLFTHMELTMILNLKRAFIMHSACICKGNRAILFSGRSGAGKSTQAELWEKLQGWTIINGDRTGVRRIAGDWKAYGLPYAGTSGIYRNDSASIQAIVFLEQAKECRIRRLDVTEAFKRMLSETFVYSWIRELQERILQELITLAGDIPVYLLACTPDEQAVQCLKEKMKEDGTADECTVSTSRT
ncbi:MAG: hypothetical protein Q4B22_00770 [Eubacteriales bacterium]|nr:hypothetical protein [Eubacteriales bacterium]